MSEQARRFGIRHSVFGKLVAIMLTMAAALLSLVGAFFLAYVGPNLNRSINDVVREYARVMASTGPGYDEAKRISARVGVEMRYEGPHGTWTTDPRLPPIERVRQHPGGYVIAPAPDGGSYLFADTFVPRLHTAHTLLFWTLLLLMAAVVVVTHSVLRGLLRPLRDLGDGVARVGDGELDVVVPRRTGDEFGALTEAFNQMVARVRDMVQARDQLLLDVSHELRSPVTRMRVALELLPDDERRRRMTADLAEMESMIAELLELERLREATLETERRDLVPILDTVVASCRGRAPGVRVVEAPREIVFDFNGDKIQAVIRNLVDNAIKYSLPGSRPVEISVVDREDRVTIRVTDDGPGIPEGDRESVFEPFFRVDPSRSRKTGGYGLGLSISKRIVEAHGGTIAALDNQPRGASFVVTLPKKPQGRSKGNTLTPRS